MDKVAVIGAGPIGCYTAYLLAKEGYRVAIFENHPKVGSPIQCTGILTNDYDKLGFPLDPYLVHIIDSIDVFSPNNMRIVLLFPTLKSYRYHLSNIS